MKAWYDDHQEPIEHNNTGIDPTWANNQFTKGIADGNYSKFFRFSSDQSLHVSRAELGNVTKELEDLFGVRLMFKSETEDGLENLQLVSEASFLQFSEYFEGQYNLSLLTYEEGLLEKARAYAKKYKEKASKSKLKILISDDGDIRFRDVAKQSKPLNRGNYTPNILEALDHVAEDLGSNDPCGRIVLLSGVPGTGKTHAVRSLPSMAQSPCYIVVPSTLLSQLAMPSFIGLLARVKPENAPIVLIIEDADEAVVQRGNGNEAVLSSVLNMSDGILGEALDIRIVATTNAKIDALDQAVLRPGRLCRRIDIGLLPPEIANAVFARLLEEKGKPEQPPPFSRDVSLAEVYSAAHGKQIDPSLKKPVAKLGFK